MIAENKALKAELTSRREEQKQTYRAFCFMCTSRIVFANVEKIYLHVFFEKKRNLLLDTEYN